MMQKKGHFHSTLKQTQRKNKEVTIVMGDMNAKIGADSAGCEQVTSGHGLGQMNENGEFFADFCD